MNTTQPPGGRELWTGSPGRARACWGRPHAAGAGLLRTQVPVVSFRGSHSCPLRLFYRFMPPDDPLGRRGPTLSNFLSRKPRPPEPSWQHCPYGGWHPMPHGPCSGLTTGQRRAQSEVLACPSAAWVLLLTGCVTSQRSFNLSGPHLLTGLFQGCTGALGDCCAGASVRAGCRGPTQGKAGSAWTPRLLLLSPSTWHSGPSVCILPTVPPAPDLHGRGSALSIKN